MTYHSDFKKELSLSKCDEEVVKRILQERFPGAIIEARETDDQDKKGTDWWVKYEGVPPLSVDIKRRKKDWLAYAEKDDLAIETWSVVENKTIGWSRDPKKRTDWVLWYWADTGRHYFCDFHRLCPAVILNWEAWVRKYPTFLQSTEDRYHSECVLVPRRVVEKAMVDATYAIAPEYQLPLSF